MRRTRGNRREQRSAPGNINTVMLWQSSRYLSVHGGLRVPEFYWPVSRGAGRPIFSDRSRSYRKVTLFRGIPIVALFVIRPIFLNLYF